MASDGKRVLRLNLPVWQGGDRPHYRIGGRVLAAIAPDAQGPEETVPVPHATSEARPVDGGIVSRAALLDILAAARAAIDRHAPDAIVALGGDCFVDLAPFAWLSERYGDVLAVLWVDAHPDVMGAAETRSAHAHVVALLVGEGDPALAGTVRRPVDPARILYVGLGETSPAEADFIRRHGIASLPGSPGPVLAWLRATGASKVAVHFDLDVLDPSLHGYLLFHDPSPAPGAWDAVPKGRMRFDEVAALLQAVAAEADIVGLGISEFMPWEMIRLSGALATLPLLDGG